MSVAGTDAYQHVADLPPLVTAAIRQARSLEFPHSCLPSHGRLLQLLAGGIATGVIGETGTGTGVGLAWLATGARPGVRLLSVEHDPERAAAARGVFADTPDVQVLDGNWQRLRAHAPFQLLALDGGGTGKDGQPPIDPGQWLQPGGVLVIDDFTPTTSWPPIHDGRPDTARLHWLQHPRLLATQLRTQPDAATIVATWTG